MSRRAPGAEEQNRATLKQLVKLESNKSCADCKRNKHPRWASWNLGVFICIRCSGIHRGMGTHISRVKSVDLDTWTDEQLQSMIKWGNARANRYWEHKLAEGHVPNESKIENFIRTKYDSKRWAMDGPIPDPSTLDDGTEDDDVPLNVVQEKARERAASTRNGSAPPSAAFAQPPRARQQIDLIGGDFEQSAPAPAPARPSTTDPVSARPPPVKAPAVAPRQTKPGESLLGLDFLGGATAAPLSRPSSTTPAAGQGRSDLKQSILSLYASKPATPAPAPQSAANAFDGAQPAQSNAQALGSLGDAFGSLSFSSPPAQQAPKPAPFSNFTAPVSHARQTSSATSALSGGTFFDAKPAPPPKEASPPPVQQTRQASNSFGADFGDFASSPSIVTSPPVTSNNMNSLFDMSPATPQPKAPAPTPAPAFADSAFNLSRPTIAPAKPSTPAATSTLSNFSAMNNVDAWGSNDAWATPDPAPAPVAKPASSMQPTISSYKSTPAPAVTSAQTPFDSGWGDATTTPAATSSTNTISNSSGFAVQQDEEFGGWSHASPVATSTGPKQGGVGGNQDDLFGNVWG